MTFRVSTQEFDQIVIDSLEQLAPEFYDRLQNENVDIVVEPQPTAQKLHELGLESNESLFGLSEGVSLRDGGSHYASMPAKITIFQRPIEEAAETQEELEDEVLRTVWHEVGHFLGFDEEEVAQMGLG